MMVIENSYDIGETVYLRTDPDQLARIVTSLIVSNAGIVYELNCGVLESRHYDIELSREKDTVLAVK